jgi:hypothetical protein
MVVSRSGELASRIGVSALSITRSQHRTPSTSPLVARAGTAEDPDGDRHQVTDETMHFCRGFDVVTARIKVSLGSIASLVHARRHKTGGIGKHTYDPQDDQTRRGREQSDADVAGSGTHKDGAECERSKGRANCENRQTQVPLTDVVVARRPPPEEHDQDGRWEETDAYTESP